jgi:outer membrane cobalamin receptor
MQTELVNKYGSHQTKFVSFSNGYKINNLDYFLSYDYLTSDGDRDHNFYRSNNPNINLGYQIDKDNRISFLSGFYKSMGGSPGQATHADLDDRQSNDKKFFDLTWEGKIFQKQDILLKIYHNIDRLEFMEAYDPDNLVYKQKDTHQTKVYGLDMQFSQSLSDGLRLALGTNYQIHNLNSSTSAKHEYNLKAFYWEAEATLLDGLTWKLGARWDDYSNFADKISPSTSFALWLWDKVKLHGLIGKSFRAPTFNDLYWPREDWGIWGGVEGSSTLRPEKATSYELGMGGYLFKRLNADLTAFITECKDLIEWTMDDTLWWRPTNIGSAKIKGIEFESGYNIFENTKLSLNYTYLDARDKDTDKWLIYRPRSYYKIKLTYIPIEKLKIDLAGKYKTKRFSDKDNTKALSSYFTLDSDMVYKVNDNTEILLSVNNIFDRYYEEEGDYPMPGLNIMAGFRKKF